jgi:hypothetical protein
VDAREDVVLRVRVTAIPLVLQPVKEYVVMAVLEVVAVLVLAVVRLVVLVVGDLVAALVLFYAIQRAKVDVVHLVVQHVASLLVWVHVSVLVGVG